MSEGRKYGVDTLFIFPLIADGSQDFVGDYTPAVGDAKIWTDLLVSTTLSAETVAFTGGGTRVMIRGDTITGATSSQTATVVAVVTTSGTWAGGNAAGFLFVKSASGAFQSENLDTGGQSNNCTIGGDLDGALQPVVIGNGLLAAAATAAEMQCEIGAVHIIDSATKAIEDQSIIFHTTGNDSALKAFDLDAAEVTLAAATHTGAIIPTVSVLTGHTAQTADHTAAIADVPTVAEFDARTILSAAYFDPAADTVADVGTVATLTGHTAQTGDTFAKFAGITLLAQWLGAMAGKQASDATAQTEMRASGAGSGTYLATADSQEGLRDRGDSAWLTATGFNTTTPPTVAQIQTELEENGVSLLDTIRDELANGADGLTALKTAIDAIPTTAMRGTDNAALASDVATLLNALVLTSATIETVTNQTNFIIPNTADATDDDAYNGAIAVFIDGTDPNQKSVRFVVNYTAATRSIEVSKAPDFVVTTSDVITIIASPVADQVWDAILTGANYNIASSSGRRLRQLQDLGQYEGGFIWVDTVNGTAGTTDGENGTVRLPVRDEADMDSLLGSTGLHGVHVVPGSAIVLESNFESLEMQGIGYTLALAGFSINDSHIFNARVSGIGTAAARCGFHDCIVNTVSVQKARFTACDFTATVTMTLAGNYRYVRCQSGVAGASAPTFAKTAGQAITAEWRDWMGGITLSGLEVGDTLTICGRLGTVNLGSPGGAVAVEIRGTYKEITNVGSASVNTDGAIKGVDVANTLADTNELQVDDVPSLIAALNDPTVGAIADQVWEEAQVDHVAAGSFGVTASEIAALQADLDNATDGLGVLKTLLDAIPTTAMRGTDGALTDKAGFSLSAAGTLAIWHEAVANIVSANTIGKLLKDEITSARMAVLTDWIDTGRLDTLLDAIPTTAMRGTDNVVLAGPTKAQMDTAHGLLATPAQVNTQVSDVLKTDTITLPGQLAPPLAPTLEEAIAWLYKMLRNRKTQTATEFKLYADDGTTVDAKSTVSDDGSEAVAGELGTGP